MHLTTGKPIFLCVLTAALLLFPADGLRALGLGEARVDSYLGQGLDVRIRLVDADDASLDALTVAPASSADYERLGVPPDALALDLDVRLNRSVSPPVVEVRSSRSVDDPVVQVLVDARWSSGRVLREYTLFLDPPTLDVAPDVRAEPSEAAVEEAPEPAREPEPEPSPEQRPARAAPAERPAEPERAEPTEPAPSPAPEAQSNRLGPVEPGQTLWSIAYGWRPDTSLSMNQVMLAIFERNPDAFMDGNVNRLRRGAELDMPDLDEVRSLSAAEADRQIREQMQAWQQEAPREVPRVTEAAVPEVAEPAPATEPATEPEPADAADEDVVHRLEVVPPEGEVYDEGAAVADSEVNRVRQEAADIEDQMFAEGLEDDSFVGQLERIREAIESREAAGLAVAEEELASLEAGLREARREREEAARLAEEAEAVADDDVEAYFRELEEELAGEDPADPVAEEQIEAEPGDDTVTDETVADQRLETDQAVAEPEPMPMLDADEPSGAGVWMWVVLGLIVIGLGGGAIWFLRHRRAGTQEAARGAGSDVAAARARVAANPGDTAAHLALLHALSVHDDRAAFSDALDDMYRQVEDDNDENWQEALNLAVVHAPDHPLLTSPETGMGDDEEGLDDRTREMLGILGSPEDDSDRDAGDRTETDEYEFASDAEFDDSDETSFTADDAFFDTRDAENSVEADASDNAGAGKTPAGTEDGDDFDLDLDLAELSDRVDAPDKSGPGVDGGEDAGAALDGGLDFAGLPGSDEDEEAPQGGADSGAGDGARSEEGEPALDFDLDELASDESPPGELTGASEPEGDSGEASKPFGGLELESDDKLEETESGTADTAAGSGAEVPSGDLDDESLDFELDDEFDAGQADDTGRGPVVDPAAENELGEALDDETLDSLAADDDEDVSEPSAAAEASEQEDLEEVGRGELEAFLSGGSGADESAAEDAGEAGELSDEDAEVKLDLARAYLSMDDPDSARTLLEEIIGGGSSRMQARARDLLDDQ